MLDWSCKWREFWPSFLKPGPIPLVDAATQKFKSENA